MLSINIDAERKNFEMDFDAVKGYADNFDECITNVETHWRTINSHVEAMHSGEYCWYGLAAEKHRTYVNMSNDRVYYMIACMRENVARMRLIVSNTESKEEKIKQMVSELPKDCIE